MAETQYLAEMKTQQVKEINWDAIKREVMNGEPMRSVARRHGIKSSRLYMRSQRENWRVRELRNGVNLPVRRETEELVRAVHTEVVAIGTRMSKLSLKCRLGLAEAAERALEGLREMDSMGLVASHKCLASMSLVCERVFQWDREPAPIDSESTKHHAINLALIRTEPAQLRAMALEKGTRSRAPDRVTEVAPGGLAIEHDSEAAGKGVAERPASEIERDARTQTNQAQAGGPPAETLAGDPRSSSPSASKESDGALATRKKEWEEWREQSRQKMH